MASRMSYNLETSDDPRQCCSLCLLAEKNTEVFGDFFVKKDISCHYFCLLTSTNLPQRGSDAAGILGFQMIDIKKDYASYRAQRCHYCEKISAPIKCAQKGCKIRFHYICGTKNNCVSVMEHQFESYCHLHHKLPTEESHDPTEPCRICLCDMEAYNPTTSFLPFCCREIEKWWFHKNCLITATAAAGFYTNCPFCADKDSYIPQIKQFGIFVPERDASWEASKNAYSELVKRTCKFDGCPNPTQYPSYIMTCSVCGCFPAHSKCLGLRDVKDYICKECFDKTFLNLL